MNSRPILRQGSFGQAVKELQTRLNQLVRPAPPLVVDGSFGAKTKTAVMTFQSARKLTVDGVVGGNTWAALDQTSSTPGAPPPPPMPPPAGPVISSLVEKAVQIALGENGVREEPAGSNRGAKVDAYNAAAGVNNGALWCMSFVYWSFQQAAAQTGQPNPMPQTAYCPFLYQWARDNQKLVTTPQRGDIFLVKGLRDGKPSVIHTGIVTGGSINTVEGNTNNDGSANGIGVFTRSRSSSSCYFVWL
ncbi:Zinc D-Ala-D-Ala carboxypeptidase precursor [Anatilimnocola aggregata]|uniref:Zinc D-Ala-D-Ala carboxypeptidase n=1 Tax=Anatilimnocola aggregata TaxID=2528021 RepID=A0A517YAJ3_9BACT|nr:peptidoglycan-binding protein [Anatilimnocola aggregata]QDU27253.1 Zinc D-Ala-D-Ala carboxypeptidase precursor [Anatilimnocola aggregata]